MTQKSAQRIPPQALDAEMSILGALLIEPEALSRVLEYVDETCFYKKAHEKIFIAATQLFEKNEPIDVITVSNQLQAAGELEAVGGSYYLTQLVNSIPSAANVEYYAKIVLDKSLKRKLINECSKISEQAYNDSDDAVDVIDLADDERAMWATF